MLVRERARQFDIYKFVLTLPGILIIYSAIFLVFFITKAVSPEGNNPILLQLGGLTFRWYGVLITIGVILALYSAMHLAERRGENQERAWAILPILLVTGIVGARAWYVINTWDKYKDHPFNIGDASKPGIFEIWQGGIAIQGAVVGGAIGLLIYKYFTHIKFFRWADFIMPGLILAQSLGRWGNFMNNEAYGSKTGLPWGIRIPCEYRTTGSTPGTENTACPGPLNTSSAFPPDATFHPTFFYESVWNYAVFITLLFMIMYPKKVERAIKIRLRDGDIFFSYLVLYSIGRFFVESFRTDSLFIIGNPVDGGIRSAQLLAIISIFIGAFFLFYRHRGPTPDTEALSVKVRSQPRVATAAADANVDAPILADNERFSTETVETSDTVNKLEAVESEAAVEDEIEAAEDTDSVGEKEARSTLVSMENETRLLKKKQETDES